MDLYAENILDHHKHPRHYDLLVDPSVSHTEANLTCGDTVHLTLRIEDDRITDIGWNGEGCAISQAAMSILSDELINKPVAEISTIGEQHIKDLLGVPVGTRRLKCALLCLHTLKNTLHTYKQEPLQGWNETVGND